MDSSVPSLTQVQLSPEAPGFRQERSLQVISEVSSFPDSIEQTFCGGQIAKHVPEWEAITSDLWIISALKGVEIPFVETPSQDREPKPYTLAAGERKGSW